jgi:2-oxo-4-hydroxy-4-carboxy-5-ureidoimidazoline decarboxylase
LTRFFERLTETLAWLEIAASPVALGLGLGLVAKLAIGGRWGTGLAIGLVVLGLGLGSWWAETTRRRHGTVAFMARLLATPEINQPATSMTLDQLNALAPADRADALATCCGSPAWVDGLNLLFPFESEEALLAAAEHVWYGLTSTDWREAFAQHPKIGDVAALRERFASTATWATSEQGAVAQASEDTLTALAAGNDEYEQKFGYIFIVCATGKSAAEMLALLQARLPHTPAEEIQVAMAEQAKITRLRLQKLLA